MRVWVSGVLVDETWVDTSNPDSLQIGETMQARHMALTDRAEREGKVWLVEVFDPAKPAGQAYLRFGTDEAGMVAPRPAGRVTWQGVTPQGDPIRVIDEDGLIGDEDDGPGSGGG